MRKTYKKPGIAIVNNGKGIVISNDSRLEKYLKRYESQMTQKNSGLFQKCFEEKELYESK